MTTAATQILQAASLGATAFKSGIKCAPYFDKKMMAMFVGRQIGETPDGESSSVRLMEEWSKSWINASLSA